MTEVWKDIPGYEGQYQASDKGRVKALPRRVRFVSKRGTESWRTTQDRVCAVNVTRTGYALVHFQVDHERSAKTVHELVMATFVGPRPQGMEVNHKDGVKTNNALPNLEYVTPSRNRRHAVEIGLNTQAMRVRGVRLFEDDAVYPSVAEAAKAIGVACGTITRAMRHGYAVKGWSWQRA